MYLERKTIEKDEEYLRQISKEVSFDDKELNNDINKIKDFCLNTECFALAAVQIGIPKRIIYLKNTNPDISIEDKVYDESRLLINPKIISRKGKTEYWEACLSCLDNMGLVVRPYEINLEYYDIKGNKHKEKFKGFESTVLSHELDHLDGILHMDIAKEILNMPKEERKIFRETHPYNIISKTCIYEPNKYINNNNYILEELFKLQDKKYRDFQIKLIPNYRIDNMIGVRTPDLKTLAKKILKENNYKLFLKTLPHKYFDENQLHAFIISEIKNYDDCINYINIFLPYVDNWATCDQMSPKIFKKNKDKLINEIQKWIKSDNTYTIRFGIGMLMQYYLDDNFNIEYLEMVSKIKSKEYYVNMMIAWFFATALAKQYDDTIKYIENNKLDKWVHNKTIQKAIESNRITIERKEYLRTLKNK